MAKAGALLLLACAPAAAHNGYSFSRTGGGQFTGTRESVLKKDRDPSIANFSAGTSVTLWIRFNDLTPSRVQIPLAINTEFQDNLFQPFGGMHGGYFFGGGGPTAVADVEANQTTKSAKDWHHYAFTWDDANSGNVTVYVDGEVHSEIPNQKLEDNGTKVNWWEENAYIIVGASGYYSKWTLNEPHNVNSDYSMDGELDDVGIYAKVLSQTEIRDMASQTDGASQADGAASDPDLILFWDFNDGYNGGVVPNKGRAGTNYDLLMGQLPKPDTVPTDSDARTKIDDVAVGMAVLESAFIVPGSVPKVGGGQDTTAPIVLAAAAGETVTSSEYGVTFTYTAPTPFEVTHIDSTTHANKIFHVVPKTPPTGATAAYSKKSGLEDTPLNIHLWGRCEWAAGSRLVPKIKALPTGGDLYVIEFKTSTDLTNKIENVGDLVTSLGRYVRYVPNVDAASASVGALYDTFVYSLVVDGVEGSDTTVEIAIQSQNDLPVVTDISRSISEDEFPGGLAILLESTDADQDIQYKDYTSPLRGPTVSITTFPSKGDLYHTTDGTAEGKYGDPISKEYSHFDVGGDVSSAGYTPTENLAVSSFWGNPPKTGYHPLNMLGEQSCFSYGECPNEQPWVSDESVYPLLGAHVRHQAAGAKAALTARVNSTDEAAQTVTIEYLKMYILEDGSAPSGPEGNFVHCHIEMSSTSMGYPGDCKPVSGAVVATVPRNELLPTAGDNWCPLQKGYGGPNNLKTGAGAFGVQSAYSHQQADYYLTAGYTEYIELRIPTPTYVVMVEFGASRGMGAIVGVKAKSPDGEWVALYKGKALVGDSVTYKALSSYWKWAPPNVCRTHFKATDFRVELDTSTETGVDDWNEYDYMKVYGSATLQPAVLPYGQNSVVYVPYKDAHGEDSFTYSASDCTGNLFRSSVPAKVSFTIAPVNDPPVASASTLVLTTSEALHKIDLGALVSDVEAYKQYPEWHQGRRLALADLRVNVVTLPSVGKLFDDGIEIAADNLPYTVKSADKVVEFSILTLEGQNLDALNTTAIDYRDVVYTALRYSVADPEGVEDAMLEDVSAEVSLEITSSELKCPEGFIATLKGLGVTCAPCPKGTIESERVICFKVDPLHYVNETGNDETGKHKCPDKTRISETFVDQSTGEASVALRSGGIEITECTCMRGTYADNDEKFPPECFDEVKGSVAIGGLYIPVAAVGYGKLHPGSSNFYACKGFQSCPGPSCDCIGGANYKNVGDSLSYQCNVGYVDNSPLCSLCDTDNGYALNLGQCNKCEMPEWAYPLIALCLVVGWFAVGGRLSEKFESLEILFGMVGFFGLYSNFEVSWNDFFEGFFSSCSFFNVDVDLVHLACFTKMSYGTLWSIQTFLPAIYIFYTLVDLICSWLISKMVMWPDFPPVKLALTMGWRPRSSFSLEAIISYYMPKGMLYMHMYYLTGVSKTIEMFKCTEGSDGETFLSASPALLCWEGEHSVLAGFNVFAFFVYLIATPLFYGYLLFVLVPKRGLYDPKLNANFGFVWGRFEEKFYYWEAVEMIRKLGLCLVQVLVTDPIVQTNCAVVIVGILLVTNLMHRPYIKFRYDVYEVVCSLTEISIMLLGNLVYHRKANPDTIGEGGPESIALVVLAIAASVSLFNIVIDLRDLVWEIKLSALRTRKGLRMSGILEISPPLLSFLDASDKMRVEEMRKFEGMLTKASMTYNTKKAKGRRDVYRSLFEVEPELLDWLLLPNSEGKDGPLGKFVSLLMNDKTELAKANTKFSGLIEVSGKEAPPLALWLSEGATGLERDLVKRLMTELVTYEKEEWKPGLADKFHKIDELPYAILKKIGAAIMSIPGLKPKVEIKIDNQVNDFARLKNRMLALAKDEQFQLQSELERLLHELQLRHNGQALVIIPAPIQQKPGAMPPKVPKLELVRAVLSIYDETAKGETHVKEILGSNKWVDWTLGTGEIKADTPSSLCFTTGKTVVVGNMLLDKRFTRVKNRGAPDVISQLCVPLISKDPSTPPILGVLCTINKVSYSGSKWGIPFTESDIEDAELFAAMVVDTFEGFTARAGARKAIALMGKKGIGGFPKGGLLAAAKVAEAKMETEGLLGDGDPVRAAFAAENAAANTAGKPAATKSVELVRTPMGLGLTVDSHYKVLAIAKDGQAKRSCGIAVGDQLVAINDVPLSGGGSFDEQLSAIALGTKVRLVISKPAGSAKDVTINITTSSV